MPKTLSLHLVRITLMFICCLNVTAIAVAGSNDAVLAVAEVKSPENIPGSQKITAEEAITLIRSKNDLVVIDSRIPDDRLQGYIETSVGLPDTETNCDSLGQSIPNTSTPALFYCNGVKCGRSAKAVKVALGCGYTNLYWFRGGIEEWKQKEYPLLQ